MKSRRVRRVRAAEEKAKGVVATYRVSSRGLVRVLGSVSAGRGDAVTDAATRAAHHLAELEARLPGLRQAIRSCRYPGAEKGDPAALVWGLWVHLSDSASHVSGAVKALERVGRGLRPPDAVSSGEGSAKVTKRSTGGRKASTRRSPASGTKAKKKETGKGPAGQGR